MKGKLLFYLLFALLWCGAVTVQAEIVSGECGAEGANVTWKLDTETNVLEISGTGAMADFKSYDKIPWFVYSSVIDSVTIGNEITTIGAYAFYGFYQLESITIPESVTSIGDYVFWDSRLRSITIPESVTSIGDMAFGCCYFLKKFEGKFASKDGRCLIVNGTLNAFAPFESESSAPQYYYPNGLSEYHIPDEVTAISNGAFSTGHDLEKFEGKFASKDGRCLIVNDTLKAFAPRAVKNYTIPEGVTAIAPHAFLNCVKLESITIGAGVTFIGDDAFLYCQSLKTATVSESVATIGQFAFSGCDSLERFDGELASADGRCLVINGVVNAFAPSGLTEYAIPDGVTAIAPFTFVSCTGLKTITMPESLTAIGTYAFEDCKGLKTLTIPNSVTVIDSFAFCLCDSLALVTIGKNVTNIGDAAFGGCCLLEKFEGKFASVDGHCLVVNDTLKAFAPGNLTEFTIPDDVTVIGESAFYLCKGLKSVTIGESVTTIVKGAFEACAGLTSLTIGSNVTAIGEEAFWACSGLKSVTVRNPEPVNIVGKYKSDDAFYEVDCSKCTLYVPSESLGKYKTTEGWNAFGTILPIGASSITETQQEQADGHITVYNLQGVLVLETDDAADLKTLQNGAYIVNGKTMIISR